MIPTTRQELIDYCLRQLGHPVIEINIDDDQLDDRVDEALQFFREYHFDGVEDLYLKVQVEASTANVVSNGDSFEAPEVIVGQLSGARALVNANVSSTQIKIAGIEGEFQDGEFIVGQTTGTTAQLAASSSITKGNYDNRYFDISDSVIGVKRVLPFSNRSTGINIFDIRYQILINDLYSLMSTDLIYYSQVRQQLELINQTLVGVKPVRFNRHMNRLYVDMDWRTDVDVGGYVIVECYRILDPDQFPDVYNDMFLKRYTTALIKRQWGNNLKKFDGVQLPGGVVLNGQRIFDEAQSEIQQIEEEIQSRFELPVDFFTG